MKFGLSINGHEAPVTSPADLTRELSLFASEQFREIWINVGQGAALCALLNGRVGWLMFLTQEGDAGFSSRNVLFDGSKSDVIEYRLNNGQRDEYPASWALPEQDVIRALEYFVEHEGGRAPFVSWHDDSV